MKKYIHKSKYFYRNKITDYGLENGYIDYATLAKAFDTVLNNDIMKKTMEIGFWEQINGIIDNSDKIEELIEKQEKIDDLLRDMIDNDKENTEEYNKLEEKNNEIESDIQELKDAEDYPPEIFQYYIISDEGARILCELTSENVFYNEELDLYIWGVTHWGTSWDYVLTDIPLKVEG
jgi:hypothetical protein